MIMRRHTFVRWPQGMVIFLKENQEISGSLFCFPVSLDAERHVRRTHTEETGDQEYNRDDAQNQRGGSGNQSQKIEYGNDKRKQKSNHAIDDTHILFHVIPPGE